MPRYQLGWVDDEDEHHPLGEPIEATSGKAAKPLLMDLYWDNRLDAASCVPVVTLAVPADHRDCTHSPCPYEEDKSDEEDHH